MGNSDGRFVWYELAASDAEKAKAFYTSVLGWETADVSMPGYTLFTAQGAPVAGLTSLQPGAQKSGITPQWMGYAGVGDVDAVAASVKKLGGTVHVPPTDIPNISRFSVVADPQKAVFALIKGRETGERQPAQPDQPGHVVWHELIAADWENAFLFYNKLLGWQKASATPGPAGLYQEFSAGGETIGGMFSQPEMGGFAVWLYYFSVTDIGAAAKKLVAGGGSILYGPVTVPGAARIVQCRDPQGGIFGLMDRRVHISIGCYSPRDPA